MRRGPAPALDPLRLAVLQALADAPTALGLSQASVDVSALLGRGVSMDEVKAAVVDLFDLGLVGGMDPTRPVGFEHWFCTHGGRDALRDFHRAMRGPARLWAASQVADAIFAASRAGHDLSAEVVTRMLDDAGDPVEASDRREVIRCRTVADAAETFVRGALRHPSEVLDALAPRSPPGSKERAREAFVAHLHEVHGLRTVIERTRPLRLVAS